MDSLVIFADGASSGNPGPGGWGVAIVTPSREVFEMGGGEAATTNNRMELTAVIRALERTRTIREPAQIHTDSTYVIRGITQWSWNWRRDWAASEARGISNVDLWRELCALTDARGKGGVAWKYVRGHAGIPGNERADEIAVAFSRGTRPPLYSGPLSGYEVDILKIPADTSLPPHKPSSAPKAAHSYISVVDGVLQRHRTWAECEARVKGRSGAKYKKTASADDEARILVEWGFSPED